MSAFDDQLFQKMEEMASQIQELKAENEKLKKENKTMSVALSQIKQWTYVGLHGEKED